MDEAFLYFHEMMDTLSSLEGEIYDAYYGVRSQIESFTIETPVELTIVFDDEGKLTIGTVPPLYPVDTTFQPSYHTIKFTAEKYYP